MKGCGIDMMILVRKKLNKVSSLKQRVKDKKKKSGQEFSLSIILPKRKTENPLFKLKIIILMIPANFYLPILALLAK